MQEHHAGSARYFGVYENGQEDKFSSGNRPYLEEKTRIGFAMLSLPSSILCVYPPLQNLNQDPGYHKVFQNEANHNATGHDNLTPQPIANGYITVTQAIKA